MIYDIIIIEIAILSSPSLHHSYYVSINEYKGFNDGSWI